MSTFNNSLEILGAAYGLRDVSQQVGRAVRRARGGLDTLSIRADNATFGDSWPWVPKTLTVVYRYGPNGGPGVKVVREGETLTIGQSEYDASRDSASGPPTSGGNPLTIWGASYGPADVTAKVRAQAGGSEDLALTADNATYGDSWPGVQKALVVVYSHPRRPLTTAIVHENVPLNVVAEDELQILGAFYGKAAVTDRAAAAIDRNAKPQTLTITADNGTFGDTWPWVPKTLTIVYRYGSDGAALVKTVREGEMVTIGAAEQKESRAGVLGVPVPYGELTVFGASYGPADVTDRVSALAAADPNLSFTANNELFGDSWPGVPKMCAVVWGYEGRPWQTGLVQEGSALSLRPA